jgi:hypothetical protein
LDAVGRGTLLVAAVALASTAPYQCKGGDDPAREREETPAEALLDLCGRFAAAKDEAAAKATLDYLIERYPSSHVVARAKEERAAEHPCAGVAAEAASAKAAASQPGPKGS